MGSNGEFLHQVGRKFSNDKLKELLAGLKNKQETVKKEVNLGALKKPPQ